MAYNHKLNETILALYIVDAFTKHPFKGNGAAVCLLPYHQSISSTLKQSIASEMNLSETAFVSIIDEEDTFENAKRFALQWYTPACEVTLCGHATIASAAVLFSVYNNYSDILEFETVSGILTARKLSDGKIQISLPAYESSPAAVANHEELIKAVIGSCPYQEVLFSESEKLLIRLGDDCTRENLEQLKPKDAELLAASADVKGVIVTLKGSGLDDCVDDDGNSYDFISRYFVPWLGISEDPVTGAAHSVLAPYWAKVLRKNSLYARQCSRRGGELRMEVVRNRVFISGDAVVVVRGQINF